MTVRVDVNVGVCDAEDVAVFVKLAVADWDWLRVTDTESVRVTEAVVIWLRVTVEVRDDDGERDCV